MDSAFAHRLLSQKDDEIERLRTGWRCFQCGEFFTDETAALLHFGKYTVLEPPLCCDRSLASFHDVLAELRRTQAHAQVMYQQKAEAEREVERLRKIEGGETQAVELRREMRRAQEKLDLAMIGRRK